MLLLGVVIGFVSSTAVYYYKLKSFKASVDAASNNVATELTNLRKKVTDGVALIESDFSKAEKAILAFWGKKF